MMGTSLLVGAFFGNKEFGTILGVVQILFAVGFAVGSSVVVVTWGGQEVCTLQHL